MFSPWVLKCLVMSFLILSACLGVPWCSWILLVRRLCKVRCFLFRKCYICLYINIKSNHPNQTTTKNYIRLTEGTFKQRYTQHKSTFAHRKLSNSTELSKYIWQLKDSNINFTTKWSIMARARPYNNSSKWCDLCLAENFILSNTAITISWTNDLN